jgi:thymidylate kinase
MLIAIEGISGAGKTTVVTAVAEYLRAAGHTVIDVAAEEHARADPCWHIGELMRTLTTTFPPAEAALLYTARTAGRARIARGYPGSPAAVVVADRLHLSLAVQLRRAGLDTPTRRCLLALATGGLDIAATVLLEVSHSDHVRRVRQRGHAPLSAEVFAALRDDFRTEHHLLPRDCTALIDTTEASPTEVVGAVLGMITNLLAGEVAL